MIMILDWWGLCLMLCCAWMFAAITKVAAGGDAYLSKHSLPFRIYHMLQSLSHMLLTQGWKSKSGAP